MPSYLDVSHRVSIADLAKISEDLTPRAVADTVVAHSSGLHLLLAPREIRDTEFVTPEAVRRIIAQLRDAVPPGRGRRGLGDHHHPGRGRGVGGHDAAAGHRRRAGAAGGPPPGRGLGVARAWSGPTACTWWSTASSGAARSSRTPSTCSTLGQRSQILIPDLERGLERAGNSRTPAEVRNQVWWRSLRTIGAELDVTSALPARRWPRRPPARDPSAVGATSRAAPPEGQRSGSRRPGRRRRGPLVPPAPAGGGRVGPGHVGDGGDVPVRPAGPGPRAADHPARCDLRVLGGRLGRRRPGRLAGQQPAEPRCRMRCPAGCTPRSRSAPAGRRSGSPSGRRCWSAAG